MVCLCLKVSIHADRVETEWQSCVGERWLWTIDTCRPCRDWMTKLCWREVTMNHWYMPTVSRLNDKAVLERGDYEPLHCLLYLLVIRAFMTCWLSCDMKNKRGSWCWLSTAIVSTVRFTVVSVTLSWMMLRLVFLILLAVNHSCHIFLS